MRRGGRVGALVLGCLCTGGSGSGGGGAGLDSANSGTSGDPDRSGSSAESSLSLMAVNSIVGSVAGGAVVVGVGWGQSTGEGSKVEGDAWEGESSGKEGLSLRCVGCWCNVDSRWGSG